MGLSQWGLTGAFVGAALGYLNFRVIIGVLEPRLRALDKSSSEEERAAFERRIVLLRRILFILEIGILAVVGYLIGTWFGG
jgi:hypothetical protein